jgi:hypothetical protein
MLRSACPPPQGGHAATRSAAGAVAARCADARPAGAWGQERVLGMGRGSGSRRQAAAGQAMRAVAEPCHLAPRSMARNPTYAVQSDMRSGIYCLPLRKVGPLAGLAQYDVGGGVLASAPKPRARHALCLFGWLRSLTATAWAPGLHCCCRLCTANRGDCASLIGHDTASGGMSCWGRQGWVPLHSTSGVRL